MKNMFVFVVFSAALAGSHALEDVCDGATAPEGKCKADGGEMRSPVLLQRESLTRTVVSSDLREDGEESFLNITGNWFGEEMSGAATITQHGKRVEVVNPHAVWSPAHGVIRGDALHFESPEVLKGEVAELASNKIQIGGHELSRHEAGAAGSRLLERAASKSGLGTGTLDQAIKTKCAYMNPESGGQPDIRTDRWAFVFSVKPKSHDLKWPVPCSLKDGTEFGKCKKGAMEKHFHCLREGHSVKQWDKEDWGYCRLCPASAVTPKCAYYAGANGEQPKLRTDDWAKWIKHYPSSKKNYPVKCSSIHPLGVCEPQEDWEKQYIQEPYCFRKEYTKIDFSVESWGYCRDCPKDIVDKHIVEEMYKETLYHFYTDQAGTKKKLESCVGDGDCGNGLVCVDEKCQEPPLSPWSIADNVGKWYKKGELNTYLPKLTKYYARVMRGSKAVLANYARIDIMNRDMGKKKKLIAKTAAKIGLLESWAQAFEHEGDKKKSKDYKEAVKELQDVLKKHKDDFDGLSETIADFRTLAKEQAKQVAARRETIRELLLELGDEPEKAKKRMKRSNNIADLDKVADKKLKKKKGGRGGLFNYEASDKKRFAELKTPDGKTAFTIDGEYVLKAGTCPQGVCAEAGASVEMAVETELFKGEEGRLYTTAKVRVYGTASAQAGCGKKVKGCKVKLSAEVGASAEQEIKYEHDLGHGVTMDTTAAVEAGVVAKADAVVGCTSKDGCRMKAKAFAGAYVKASVSQTIGNDDVSGQIGGSVIVGEAAGASADVEANYNDGKLSLGGEVCGTLVVGGCVEMAVEVDMSTVEDLAEGFVEDVNDLQKEGGKVAFMAAQEAAKGAEETVQFLSKTADDMAGKVEDTYKAASAELDKIGGALEGGWNEVTEELFKADLSNLNLGGFGGFGGFPHSAFAKAIQNPRNPVDTLATAVTSMIPIPSFQPPRIIPDSRRRRSKNIVDQAIGWFR